MSTTDSIDSEEIKRRDDGDCSVTNLSFYQQLIRPKMFEASQLLSNKNQVAGHAGFFSLIEDSSLCLKPFNTKCVRGRREHLFYQLLEYSKKQKTSDTYKESKKTQDGHFRSEKDIYSKNQPTNALKILYYNEFNLITYPSPPNECRCVVDQALFKLLSSYIPRFHHVNHLLLHNDSSLDHLDSDIQKKDTKLCEHASNFNQDQYLKSLYSQQLTCPCYGSDPKKKSSCSRDYEKVDFLCLEDLTAHCNQPCIIDIKVGKITYDPMAIKEKVLEQSSKYRRLKEFGFRILGMKLGDEIKDKSFGKTLETVDQVCGAFEGFFSPLIETSYKCIVVEQIVSRLQGLLDLFDTKNLNQMRFFSSSLLIVYDSFIDSDKSQSAIQTKLVDNVRVSMIDFAHVFHIHNDPPQAGTTTTRFSANINNLKDDNYIYGLMKLTETLTKLLEYYHSLLPTVPSAL